MRPRDTIPWPVVLLLLLGPVTLHADTPERLSVGPRNPFLFGKGARQRLVVTAHYGNGAQRDVTRQAEFSSVQPAVAEVDRSGIVTAVADGGASIVARFAGRSATTTALVQRAADPPSPSFTADVMPVLTRIGCNGGNCHGALNGQNGFKLSLFGYEPEADHKMIVEAHDGRRLCWPEPEKSLLLLKPTFQLAHGGGAVLNKDSREYRTLLAWIQAGARYSPATERRLVDLAVFPAERILWGRDDAQQLLVTARYSDGSSSDVTGLVHYRANDDSVVEVSADGLVKPLRYGETAIVIRAPGRLTLARVAAAAPGLSASASMPQPVNFIDRHVFAKLRELGVTPSGPATDAAFLRRAFLDIIGLLPTSDEARRFLADRDPQKREKLVESLLARPEYADQWTIFWGDLLTNTKQLLYGKGPFQFTRWLHDAFASNLRLDEFARRLITSSGNMFDVPETSYYPLMKKPEDLAAVTSQLFLGVSIDCARCHNHPLEKWTRDDFLGMAALFSQVRYKNAGPRNNERILYVDFQRQLLHPETKQSVAPRPLGGPTLYPGERDDRREMLAAWLTAPENAYFARAMVNRLWKHFMGRGLVEPIDDFRATNPATNEPLLDELGQYLRAHNFDQHQLIRAITSSRAYQLSAEPNSSNRDDRSAYPRRYLRRMTAEQLLDAIAQATEIPEKFDGHYPGTRAMQLDEPEIPSYFLEAFDRPLREVVCERRQAPTLTQALHLIAGSTIQEKITASEGGLRRLLARALPETEIIEELYLRTLSRFPGPEEMADARRAVANAARAEIGLEDVFWALLNSSEFLYNH